VWEVAGGAVGLGQLADLGGTGLAGRTPRRARHNRRGGTRGLPHLGGRHARHDPASPPPGAPHTPSTGCIRIGGMWRCTKRSVGQLGDLGRTTCGPAHLGERGTPVAGRSHTRQGRPTLRRPDGSGSAGCGRCRGARARRSRAARTGGLAHPTAPPTTRRPDVRCPLRVCRAARADVHRPDGCGRVPRGPDRCVARRGVPTHVEDDRHRGGHRRDVPGPPEPHGPPTTEVHHHAPRPP
jgi:hypothetical protein